MKNLIEISFTSKDWQFGFGFTLPAISKQFYLGSKLVHGFTFSLYLGPVTVDIGRSPVGILEISEAE